jgi:hypothetical protein
MTTLLLPREHGAYAQLGFPLLTGLALGSPGAGAWLFAAAALFFFLANEPLAILVGARGRRPQQELGVPARRRLFVLVSLGTAAGMGAMILSPVAARWLALVPAAIAGSLVPAVFAKRLKTLAAEVVAGAAFAAASLPVAAAGGVAGVLLWGPALMWFVVTIAATFCVHAIKARVTGTPPWAVPAASWVARGAVLAALVASVWIPGWRVVALAACAPLAGVLVVNYLAPSPRRLKRVGWALVVANALAVAILATL